MPAAIRFDDFASIQGLSLVGDAEVSGKALRLTPARHDKSGAVWFREKQPVRLGFDTTFRFQLTHQGGVCHGADGLAFVLQNSGSAASGGRGSAGGFAVSDPTNPQHAGIPWSIAVFLDTCRNEEEGDPSSNYIAIRISGKPNDMRWPTARLAFTPELSIHLKDHRVHTTRIVYRPPVISVFLDGSMTPVLETVVDLSIVTDQQGSAWVGFTASTGWGYQNHDILTWSFAGANVSSSMYVVSSDISFPMSACLPNRNLCTPERTIVEQIGAGYHIVVPANLEWGASVSRPVRANGPRDECPRCRLLGIQGTGLGRMQRAFRKRRSRRHRIGRRRRTSWGVDHENIRRGYVVLCERPQRLRLQGQ